MLEIQGYNPLPQKKIILREKKMFGKILYDLHASVMYNVYKKLDLMLKAGSSSHKQTSRADDRVEYN